MTTPQLSRPSEESVTDRSRRPGVATILKSIASAVAPWGTIGALALITLAFAASKPSTFATVDNLKVIFDQAALLAIVALGLTLCLISWDFDLSIGAMATLAGLTVALLLQHGWPMGWAIAVTMAMAAAFGLVNGLIVAKFKVSAFIGTLAMASILTGLGNWWTNTAAIPILSSSFYNLDTVRVGRVHFPVIVAGAVFVVTYVTLEHMKLGRKLYAVGANPAAARIAGIRVSYLRIGAFSFCSVAAALAGILLAARLAGGYQGSGDPFLLNAYAAAFIGAVTLKIGHFTALGTVVGVLLLTVVTNGLNILGTPLYVTQIVEGGILIAAVAISGLARVLGPK
jgi:ribose transport system permease protein